MLALRLQYFLAFAVMGSILPFISVYFKQEGLNETQIGFVLAAASVAAIISPALMGLLADTRLDARRLLAGTFLALGAALIGVLYVRGLAAIVAVWSAQSLAAVALLPLQDGVNFSIQQQREAAGQPRDPYHHIRVWGTIGFVLPGLVLWGLLAWGLPISSALVCGAALAVLGAINAFLLPPCQAARPARAAAGKQLPTLAAARVMFRGPLLVFCIAAFLIQASTAAYYGFFSIYVVSLGVGKQWLGPIMNVGQAVEIFFVLGFAWLWRRLGMRWLLVVGFACIAARFGLLAAWPVVAVAVASQLFHGIMVVVQHVVPPVLLNQSAEEPYRHSMQGLFTMAVAGLGRFAGNLAAGPIARQSITGVFAWAAGLTAIAVVLLIIGYRPREQVSECGSVGVSACGAGDPASADPSGDAQAR